MANDIVFILLFIIILAIIFILLARYVGNDAGNVVTGNYVTGGTVSKLESRVVRILEDITGRPFNQAHPQWLRDTDGTILELDGYNDELKVAIEVQGPGHIKPIPGETYEKYRKRVARDKLKREICAARGVYLITADYRISLTNMSAYLRSRLFDAGTIKDRPPNYIKEIEMVPWERGN